MKFQNGNNSFAVMNAGVNSGGVDFGTEVYISEIWETNNNDSDILYIVKFASSGTELCNIQSNWSPLGTLRYTLKSKYDIAYNKLKQDGLIPEVTFLWIQGESDSQDSQCAIDYGDNLCNNTDSMFDFMRSFQGAENAKIVFSELATNNSWLDAPSVIAGQSSCADTNTILVTNTTSLTQSDNVHYDNNGLKTLSEWVYPILFN